MSVTIGDVKIHQKFVRRITTALGGYVGIYISALDDSGLSIKSAIGQIQKDQVYDFHSYQVSGIVKVTDIKIETKETGGRKIYKFNIELQIIA